MLDETLTTIGMETALFARVVPQILLAILIALLFFGIGYLLGRALKGVMRRTGLAASHIHFFTRLLTGAVTFLGVMIGLRAVGLGDVSAAILAGGGFTALAVGFALRGIGENLLAGLFLAFSRPFDVGDLIRTAGFEGVVHGVSIRHTHIRGSDARDIFIPNAVIFNEPLINLTRDGLRRPSFTLTLGWRDDLEAARRLLEQTIARVDHVLERPPPKVVALAFQPAHIELEISFWIDAFSGADYAEVQSRAMEACRRALIEGGYKQ